MYEHTRYGATDPNFRVGDKDREATADRLRRSNAEGRLDVEEFQQRLDRCYEAKTVGNLDQIVADLPGEVTHERRLSLRRMPVMPLVPILLAILVISVVSGPHDHRGYWGLWTVIPLFFFARFVLWPYRWRGVGRRGRGTEPRV